MKRKTIAVCVTGYDWEYETRVVKGIYERCQEKNINLLAFATLMRRPELNTDRVLPESIVRGELEIFHLINYDLIDGIVILGDSMIQADVIYEIAEQAKQHGVPILNINDPNHELEYNILLSDKIAMEFVVRHLVEDHGLRKINFIGGFPGNLQTEQRLAAYRKILTEHGIPVEEKRIAYGEFWKKAAVCTEQFLSSGDKPEAIVCASDTMAFFCMDYLKEHGYRIPEDIVVTGFDGIQDCEIYRPTLTTVRRAFQEAGELAVDVFCDIFAGKKPEKHIYVDSVLVRHQSCGCVPKNQKEHTDFCDSRYGELNNFMEFNTYIFEMNTRFASAKNSEELYWDTKRGAEFFKLRKLYICICSNIEKNNLAFDKDEIRQEYTGLSDTMLSMLQYGHGVPIRKEFATKQLLPEPFLYGDKAIFYAFSPLYFKNRFLGYLAYEPTKTRGMGDFFATWVMSISNNAGSFYMNNELEYVVDELENLYMRDPLTGLYNRRGMTRFGYNVIERAKKNSDWVTIVCADLDRLKPINDLYGHEAGDNAILQAAKAIETAMPQDSICIRTGGDEFCVILSHHEKEDVQQYIARMDGVLAAYSQTSGLPYQVGCSCGYCSVCSDQLVSIEQMIKAADENMYQVKVRKKANRR